MRVETQQEGNAVPLKQLSSTQALLWILCLAFLSVGARNFEQGLSGDGPLYSNIARNIARSGEWFRLDAGVPDFIPFAEHPHLGFWIVSIIFKVLPPSDWSARIPGHLFYIGFLWIFFLYIRGLSNEKTAVLTILILWMWARFSNPFSNVFLDPAMLFFGGSGVFLYHLSCGANRKALSATSGVCLALCAMTKGIAVLGFIPVMALLGAQAIYRRGKWKSVVILTAILICSLFAVLLLYALSVRVSAVPEFFQLYWARQMTRRFIGIWRLRNLLDSEFWWKLFRHTHFMAPFCLLGLRRMREGIRIWIPFTLMVTFILIYAPGLRSGGQYWLTIMPWMAWLISEGVVLFLPFHAVNLVRASAVLAIAGVFIIQYLPVSTHGMAPSADEAEVGTLSREAGIHRLYIDWAPSYVDFINSCRYAWYGDVKVEYVKIGQAVPAPDFSSAYLLFRPDSMRLRGETVRDAGWCLLREYSERSLWADCRKK